MAMATRIGWVSPNFRRFATEAADQLAGQHGSRDDSSGHHATAPVIVNATLPVEASSGRSQPQWSTRSRY